ncbi:MAG TPA: hypothetical protein VLH39_01135, partial [Magnetospirillaceae bacterium]|nr:hypothetical protein [Magnetospirillaceae bacterium]
EDLVFLRDPENGDPISRPGSFDDPARFDAPNAQWDIGLVLGLIPGYIGNRLEAFLLYRGRWSSYRNDFPTTVFPDARGLFGTAILAGFGYDDLRDHMRGVRSGFAAEVSAEWAPGFLAYPVASVEYLRFNSAAQVFVPLLPADSPAARFFVPLFGARAAMDAAAGPVLPIFVLQSFGGRYGRRALAGEVRGYPDRAYDASIKAYVNLELRVYGPALGPARPVVFTFLDAGWYFGLDRSASFGDASGVIASAGAGAAVGLWGAFRAGFYAGVLLPGYDRLFPIYVPGGEKSFASVMFIRHF